VPAWAASTAGGAAAAGGTAFTGDPVSLTGAMPTPPDARPTGGAGFVVAPSPRSSGPWVGSVMDRPQPLDGDVGIELRGGERSVTEQFLNAS
jgi:hypothetical protein